MLWTRMWLKSILIQKGWLDTKLNIYISMWSKYDADDLNCSVAEMT